MDLATSTVTLVPTKDAVVLARFHTHVGYKALFTLQSRGQPLPFGSEVRAKDTSSIVASEGQVYLAGLAPKGILYAQWGPGPQQRCSARYDLTPDAGADTPSTHPTAGVIMFFFNSPASGRSDAVTRLVTDRQRMGLLSGVCPRPGLHPSAERGATYGVA
ncbi:hypothetical protein LNO20_12880 [Klebsiella quasipneumoniae subsp. quasipneumoniae]|nr:hypothetical protein [Klebsiella quasipneumoniae subsp. quasipneumoniae]